MRQVARRGMGRRTSRALPEMTRSEALETTKIASTSRSSSAPCRCASYATPSPASPRRRSAPASPPPVIASAPRLRPWRLRCNAEMPSAVLRATCRLDSLGERTLADLVERRRTFTARSIDRLIKVARTVADLLGQDDIDAGCLLEAAAFRDVDPAADLVSQLA